ncbi:Uncharacterised protein [Corynebacterium diphtheriae]|nr:Uncharacterised protein [Corynebacterium diphtheriae]
MGMEDVRKRMTHRKQYTVPRAARQLDKTSLEEKLDGGGVPMFLSSVKLPQASTGMGAVV